MPQKLRPKGLHLGGPNDVDNQNIEMFAEAYSAISGWANQEAELLEIYLLALGGQKSPAASAYLALTTRGAKSEVLNAALSAAIPEQKERFKKVLKAVKQMQKFRDKLAHWQFAKTDLTDNTFVLVNSEKSIRNNVSVSEVAYLFTKKEIVDFKWQLRAMGMICFAFRVYFEISDKELQNKAIHRSELIDTIDEGLEALTRAGLAL